MTAVRVRLIHWNEREAEERATVLRAAGYEVDAAPLCDPTLRDLRSAPPAAILIDLTRLPSQGRDFGVRVRTYKDTRAVPLVFVGGAPEKIARVKKVLPDAVFTAWEELLSALVAALTGSPVDPVVPGSVMAGYSGTPLPAKLGIGPGCGLVLLHAPDSFARALGPLPEGATQRRRLGPGADVIVWFVRNRDELEVGIGKVASAVDRGRLWIAWPKKSSGMETDLTQQPVRALGLSLGLVDFKVAAIDEIWTALCFTRRREPGKAKTAAKAPPRRRPSPSR
ncbi:MAG: hypothetical protein WDA75_00095 [Candidatus Latescibacterota bacterium]|jgi:hypothetical protein